MFPTPYRDVTHFFSNFANWTHPLDGKVYVISDTEYKKVKQEQVLKDIAVLEERALSYEKAAERTRKTMAEMKQEAGLLPAEQPEAAGTPASLDACQS
jgi:murein L,D-transpeptidase YafK